MAASLTRSILFQGGRLQLSNNELQHSTTVWARNEDYPGYLKMGVWGMWEDVSCYRLFWKGGLGLPD